MERNECYLTAMPGGSDFRSAEEAETLWNEGRTFRVYQGYMTSKEDSLKLRMAGFTHVRFVWQDPNEGNAVRSYALELKSG